MTDALTVQDAKENIYRSLAGGNEDIDSHITALKAAMAAAGEKTVTFDPERLAQNNRSGRKMMCSYFKKRGVVIEFTNN
jgi:hypothetical protein